MKKFLPVVILAVSGGFCYSVCAAERKFDPRLKEIVSPRVDKHPAVDARLDDDAWQRCDVADEFVSFENSSPASQTVWVVCHHGARVYFGFLCQDGEVITATHERDQIGNEDWIEVQIVTDGRLGNDFRFRINPSGARLDARREAQSWNPNPDWEGASRTTETGWTAEMGIPFAAITRANAVPTEPWFIRVFRNDASKTRPGEFASWTPFGRKGSLNSAVYGLLHFAKPRARQTSERVRMLEGGSPLSYQPRNGSTLTSGRVISWAEEPAAALYELQISSSPQFPKGRTLTLTTTVARCSPPALPKGHQWFWRYRMRAFGGWVSEFSKVRTFFTAK